MSVYYTVALVALISAVVFTLLAVTLFFTWNIRKLRRDVKGISLRSKIVDSASASVDSYIQMTEAHGEDLGTLDMPSSGNLDTLASASEAVAPVESASPVVASVPTSQGIAPVEESTEPTPVSQGIEDIPNSSIEESATTLLVETHDTDEEYRTTLLDASEGTHEDTHKVLKPVVTYQSWA